MKLIIHWKQTPPPVSLANVVKSMASTIKVAMKLLCVVLLLSLLVWPCQAEKEQIFGVYAQVVGTGSFWNYLANVDVTGPTQGKMSLGTSIVHTISSFFTPSAVDVSKGLLYWPYQSKGGSGSGTTLYALQDIYSGGKLLSPFDYDNFTIGVQVASSGELYGLNVGSDGVPYFLKIDVNAQKVTILATLPNGYSPRSGYLASAWGSNDNTFFYVHSISQGDDFKPAFKKANQKPYSQVQSMDGAKIRELFRNAGNSTITVGAVRVSPNAPPNATFSTVHKCPATLQTLQTDCKGRLLGAYQVFVQGNVGIVQLDLDAGVCRDVVQPISGTASSYFLSTAMLADGESMLVSVYAGLYVVNLQTQKVTRLNFNGTVSSLISIATPSLNC